MTDLARLLDLPAVARLSAAGGELQLITLTHDHADKITIERRRLGTSIDLHELLGIIGSHGLADAPRVELSAVPVPELPAPADAPVATVRRTRKHPEVLVCVDCEQSFKTPHALQAHRGVRYRPLEQSTQWPCPDCEKVFATVQALGSHSKAHKHRQKAAPTTPAPLSESEPASRLGRFVCPQCGKEFRSQKGYDTHIEYAHTPLSAQPPSPTVPLREYTCQACHKPLQGHERCGDCQGLLGKGHESGEVHMVVNGKPLCELCFKYRGTARNVFGASA